MSDKNTSPTHEPGKLRLIWRFLRGCRGIFLACCLFALLLALFDLINPKIISFTVDTVLGSEPNPYTEGPVAALIAALGGVPALRERIWIVALALIAVSALSVLCRYLFTLLNSVASEKLVRSMREMLFSHIERLPFSWHDQNQTGDIIQRCTSDVDMVKKFLSEQLTSVVRIVLLIALSLFFMFGIHTGVALIAACSIPIIIAYSAFFHRRISRGFKKCDEAEGVLSAIAQENLTGVRVVRAFGRENFERERFHRQSGLFADLWVRLSLTMSVFWGVGDLLTGAQVLAVLISCTVLCVKGSLTVGDLVALTMYNGMLSWPVRRLGRVISQMSQTGVSLDRIAYIMNSAEEADAPSAEAADMHGDIAFEDVSFRYATGDNVLSHISFTVPEGSTFGILGGTGSGKTTLMYLLDRLYTLPAECGRITVGGVDIASRPAAQVRRSIGMVMQEPYLFSRTIAENIRITGEADESGMRRAAEIACLDDTVQGFAEGYETTVGERGVTLSGGQKQRTAIAQMLARRTPIMIFDDSLSAVDAETDVRIRRALRENTANATVILISHRTSTLAHCDRIAVLEHGELTDIGTHEELISRDGLYSRIYKIQNAQKEVE